MTNLQAFLNEPFHIGSFQCAHRLLQGPLAGFSCAPFRQLYTHFLTPAYAVSEMISAQDVLYKHAEHSRYLYRAPDEKALCYQIAGTDPLTMAKAAIRLEALGADLIDINCGCPKPKIRKKGAGSALLEQLSLLSEIVSTVRQAIDIPLTVKVRLLDDERNILLARAIENAGADALIVHGRHWSQDYDTPCDLTKIALIKRAVTIPVIANGDMADEASLDNAVRRTACDGYMIARAGTGKPWLYQHLLTHSPINAVAQKRMDSFISHLQGLAQLEGDYKAVLQSRALVRYYFKGLLTAAQFSAFYRLDDLAAIVQFVKTLT